VEAIRAGRDAYVEKPLAHTMEDALAIRNAVKNSDRVFAVGTQRRSSPTYQKACEFIKSGQFGDIVFGGDDLECESTGTLAAAQAGSATARRGYGLEALLDQSSVRTV